MHGVRITAEDQQLWLPKVVLGENPPVSPRNATMLELVLLTFPRAASSNQSRTGPVHKNHHKAADVKKEVKAVRLTALMLLR